MNLSYLRVLNQTGRFILSHPKVLMFSLYRLLAYGLIYRVLIYFLPEMQLVNLLKDTSSASMMPKTCMSFLPCDFLIFSLFFMTGLLLSVATCRFVFASSNQKSLNTSSYFNLNWLAILFVTLILAPIYFFIFKYFIFTPNIATLLYLLTPAPLLILLLFWLPTFLIAPQIAINHYSLRTILINSWQIVSQNWGKISLFIIIFYLLAEIGIFVFLNAVSTNQLLVLLIVGTLLAILVTIKDVFKAIINQ